MSRTFVHKAQRYLHRLNSSQISKYQTRTPPLFSISHSKLSVFDNCPHGISWPSSGCRLGTHKGYKQTNEQGTLPQCDRHRAHSPEQQRSLHGILSFGLDNSFFYIKNQFLYFMIQLLSAWLLNEDPANFLGDSQICSKTKNCIVQTDKNTTQHPYMSWEQRKNRGKDPAFPQSQKHGHDAPQGHSSSPRVMTLSTEVTGSFSHQLLDQESVILSSCDQDKIASTQYAPHIGTPEQQQEHPWGLEPSRF